MSFDVVKRNVLGIFIITSAALGLSCKPCDFIDGECKPADAEDGAGGQDGPESSCSASTCADGPCMKRACVNNKCKETPQEDGSTPVGAEDAPGDCKRPVCVNGKEEDAAEDDLPAEKPCVFCDGTLNGPVFVSRYVESKGCDNGNACDGSGECRKQTGQDCNDANGQAECVSGTCKGSKCLSGVNGPCKADQQCIATSGCLRGSGNIGVCKQWSGNACDLASDCGTNLCNGNKCTKCMQGQDKECGSTLKCTMKGACQQECKNDSECPQANLCNNFGFCESACDETHACGPAMYCINTFCVPEQTPQE